MQLTQKIISLVRTLALLAVGSAFFANVRPTAQAQDFVPFKVSYHLELSMVVDNFPLATVTSTGSALATHLGLATTESIEETVNLVTGVGIATHEFTAANGDVISVDFLFLAIPTSETAYTIQGNWEISGGTGHFEGASGSGTYGGTAVFTSPSTALASFQLTGVISSKGSLK